MHGECGDAWGGREHPRVPLQWSTAPGGDPTGTYTRLAA